LEECENNATGADKIKIKDLKDKIKLIIGNYSSEEALIQIYLEFKLFFELNPNLKVLIFNTKINGFGKIKSFFDISRVKWRIKNYSLAIGGANCEVLEGMLNITTDTSLSISVRSDFLQLHNKLKLYFDANLDIELRIKYFAEQCYEFLILTEWNLELLYSIQIEGYGSVYDLIYAFIFSVNNNSTQSTVVSFCFKF
jgi:hypothetical protein